METGVAAARSLFKSKARLGQDRKADTDHIWTQHENTITGLGIANVGGKVTKISTSGFDGRLVLWQLSDLNLDMSALRLN